MKTSWSTINTSFSVAALLAASFVSAQSEVDIHQLVVPTDETAEHQSALLELPLGLHRIEPESTDSKRILIAIHDEHSNGFEWIHPLQTLDDESTMSYFVRWDPSICPDTSIESINNELSALLDSNKSVHKVTIIGLGLGGVYLSQFVSTWKSLVSLDAHVIAAPLQGTIGVFAKEDCGELLPKRLPPTIRLFQWRIPTSQNAVFKKLEVDPQEIELEGSLVIKLPAAIDGTSMNEQKALEIVATRVQAEYLEATGQVDKAPAETSP